MAFEISDILGKACAETNPNEAILQTIAHKCQKSYEDIKSERNKAVMLPFKKTIFGVAFVVTGFLAFTGVLAFVLNRDISFFEIVIVFVLLFFPLVITLILYKKQTAKPKI